MDALEAPQLFHRRCHAGGVLMAIKLHNLIARPTSAVRDIDLYLQTSALRDLLGTQAQVRIVKRGVAEAVSERIKRCWRQIEIAGGILVGLLAVLVVIRLRRP